MSWIFHHFAWKLLSLVVAFGIWFVVMSSNPIELPIDVSLDLDLPSGLMVANDVPDKVSFRLAGSKFFLRTLANSLDSIRVDLSKAKAGRTYYSIDKDSLHLPIGVKVLSISPTTINPILEAVDHRSVPVRVVKKNALPNGYRLVKLQPIPKNVRIKGPRSVIEKISEVSSQAVDLADIPASLKWEVPLVTSHAKVSFEEEVEPKVAVEVEPTDSNFRVAGVPLRVQTSKKFSVKPEKVALFVSCPPNLIRTLTPDQIKAYVDVPETKAGTYVREVRADLPAGVRLVRIVPDRVQVQLN